MSQICIPVVVWSLEKNSCPRDLWIYMHPNPASSIPSRPRSGIFPIGPAFCNLHFL